MIGDLKIGVNAAMDSQVSTTSGSSLSLLFSSNILQIDFSLMVNNTSFNDMLTKVFPLKENTSFSTTSGFWLVAIGVDSERFYALVVMVYVFLV